jgi:hypothetical protein
MDTMNANAMPQYWIVGGMYFDGTEDHSDDFFSRGFWQMRPDSPKLKKNLPLISQIRTGDSIALKRKLIRPGSFQIRVVARGTILEPPDRQNRVRVDWTTTGLNILVDGRGCAGTIHGPFDPNDPWTKQVFEG